MGLAVTELLYVPWVILSLLCIQSHFIISITLKNRDFSLCFPCKKIDAVKAKVSGPKGGAGK